MLHIHSQQAAFHTDLALVLSDRKGFDALFQHYYPTLNRFALSIVCSPEMAEEIAADVFVKIWKNRAELNISTSLKAYLFTAVRHQAIDYLRKSARQCHCTDEVAPDYPSGYHSPEDEAITSELEKMIEIAVDELPPQGQKVFRLNREQGMKYHEIAAHLNLSIKTVETHMGRSLRYLRERLQPHCG